MEYLLQFPTSGKVNYSFNHWSYRDVDFNREGTAGDKNADCGTGSNKGDFMQMGPHFLPHFRKHYCN